MTEHACVHQCLDGWITTKGGLMPCPKHNLAAHERWAEGTHEPTGGRTDAPHAKPDPETTAQGIAAARAAIARATRKEQP